MPDRATPEPPREDVTCPSCGARFDPADFTHFRAADPCPDHVWEVEGQDLTQRQFQEIRAALPAGGAHNDTICVAEQKFGLSA